MVSKAAPDLREVSNVAAGLARQQAAELVVGLTKSKRQRLRSLLARSLDQGWSDTRLRLAIADVVGLDDRYASAVENYRAGLLAQGVAPGKARQASVSYAKRLLQRRAASIGANETQKAMLDAQRLMWEQQRVDGEVSPYAVRVWRTHPDERRCPICRPLDGTKASLKPGGGYTVGGGIGRVSGPPVHPACRCYEEVVDLGIIKYAEIEKHLPGLHDQHTHGNRHFQGLRKDIVRSMQDESDKGGVRGAFAQQILQLGQHYPHIAANVRGVDISSGSMSHLSTSTAVAVTEYTRDGLIIRMDPSRMRDALDKLLEKRKSPDFKPHGFPEITSDYDASNDQWWMADNPDLAADYAGGVAVHEFGHVAHWHFTAAQRGWHMNDAAMVRSLMGMKELVPEVRPLTHYAKSSTPEMMAEWFVGYYFDILPEQDKKFIPRFEDAAHQELTVSRGDIVYVEKAYTNTCSGEFDGSYVEWIALGLLKQIPGRKGKDKMIFKMAHESLDRSPKHNWVENAGGLPAYIEHIATDLHTERAMPISRAIAVAISRCKLWAAGGGNVKPDTQAKASAAIAEWEKLKAKNATKKD